MDSARYKLYELLQKYVPENAVHYCYDLWCDHPFGLKITRKRNSKLGDYRFDRISGQHNITINHNLNPYAFLMTYIHEVAHLTTTTKYKRRVPPHGKAWKSEFNRLMVPVMNELIFPKELLALLRRHMLNPKASSQSDPALVAALQQYDKTPDGFVLLDALEHGNRFIFQGQPYEKLATRRTRVLCCQMTTGRKYLIPKVVLVRPHEH